MFTHISPYALTPLWTALLTPWLMKLANSIGRSTADQDAKNGTYRYSKGIIIISQIFLMLLPMLPFFIFPLREIENGSWLESGPLPQVIGALILLFAFECLMFVLLLYMERYTIKLDDQTLTISAFRSRTIRYVDIIKFAVEPRARQTTRLKLTVSKGNDVIIPGSLPKFDGLVNDLHQHVYGGSPDRS